MRGTPKSLSSYAPRALRASGRRSAASSGSTATARSAANDSSARATRCTTITSTPRAISDAPREEQRVSVTEQVGDDHHTLNATHSFEERRESGGAVHLERVNHTNHLPDDVATRTRHQPATAAAEGDDQSRPDHRAATDGGQTDAEHPRLTPLLCHRRGPHPSTPSHRARSGSVRGDIGRKAHIRAISARQQLPVETARIVALPIRAGTR